MSSTTRDYGPTYKILVLGESGVGKTSLIRRFTDEQYQESYISTIGIDSRTKKIKVDDEESVRLQIWDTAGQERFRTITSAYYRGAMGVALVYDITTESSFSSINNWLDTIEQNASPNVCRILIGNKCDSQNRMVTEKKGSDRAASCNLEFFETSAKDGTNVEQAFKKLASMIRETKKMVNQQKKEHNIIVDSELDSNRSKCC